MTAPDQRWYELRNSVFTRDFGAAMTLVSADPGILNSRNGIGETVLHFLAVEDDLEGVAWLHARGSDLDTKNEFGTPVLFEVAQLGYEALFKWFIAHGANIHARDSDDRSIVDCLQEFEDQDMVAIVRKYGA